jgi:hypothetical protein
MKNRKVIERKQKLDHLFEQTKYLPENAAIQSHWARYLCVLISGFIENSVSAIYSEYAGRVASPHVANYVDNQLRRFQNPNMERILQLTRSFNRQWAENLEISTKGELKDAVDSVISTRNSIAHGRYVEITYHRVQDYYKNTVKVIELIENLCNSNIEV